MGVPGSLRCFLTRTLCFALLAAPLAGHAQQPASDTEPAPAPFTFRIFEDVVQLPTLALTHARTAYTGLTAPQFSLQFDAGPAFHPRRVRVEGDDPLSVALVLDAGTDDTRKLLAALDRSTQALPLDALTRRDTLSVYAADCILVRTLTAAQYSPALLHAAVRDALAAPGLHLRSAQNPACGSSRRLWDILAMVTGDLQTAPGRRILLAVTNGIDTKSQTPWKQLSYFAARYSVTIFGLRPQASLLETLSTPPAWVVERREKARAFDFLAVTTGGTVLTAPAGDPWAPLATTLSLVRSRYILEFIRPREITTGFHEVRVELPDKTALISTTGLVFPPRDHKLEQDPNTLPSDLSSAPVVGKRKILVQPQ